MTLCGTVARTETADVGEFLCPQCEQKRYYKHIRIATYFSVMGVDLYKNGLLADYVKCQHCERQFAPTGVNVRQEVFTMRQAEAV